MRIMVFLTVLAAGFAVAQEGDEANGQDVDPAAAEAASQVATEEGGGVKTMSGMSILGNEEAPKSLVIVPWKSSRLGDGLGVSNALDDTPRAVDRDVFMRELRYFELRSGGAD